MTMKSQGSRREFGLAAGLLSLALAACGASAVPDEDQGAVAAARAESCAVCGPVCAQPAAIDAITVDLGSDELVLAALHDDAAAQFRLGMLFLLGEGVEPDDLQAGTWLRRAAEQGHADAQNELGAIHEFGRGVPRDDVLAQAWYAIAAAQGHATARTRRDRLAVVMPAGELERARQEEADLRARIQAAGPAATPGR